MDWFLIAARTLHFAAAILLTGVLGFECLIASPAIQRSGAGFAGSSGLRRRLWWLAAASLLLALASGAAWLAVVAAHMSGKPLDIVLSQGVVAVVLTRTRFGEDWLLRLGLAMLLAFCLVAQKVLPVRAAGAIGWTGLTLAAVMLASLAWAGHGAATPGAPGDLHLAGDILHLLGAGMWLGTLPPLAFLLAAAQRAGDANWAAVTRIATRRYSALAVSSVMVLLAGGLANTWFLAGTVPALVGTEYGRLLLAKIALFVVMLLVAAVNLLRLTPRLARPAAGVRNPVCQTVARLQHNAWIEAGLGFGVLAIVGALGTLPPGLHTEPGWPFPFRVEIGALTVGSKILLAILAVIIFVCVVATVTTAAAGHYRRTAMPIGVLVVCVGLAWIAVEPAVEPAYPTSFYAPAEPYAAASVVQGAALYAENCVLCHGATGRGDGSAAAQLPIRPADLNEPHLFAQSPGDLYWWVSQGRDNGVMPGFAGVMTPRQRWDVINFILARAAGVLAHQVGATVTSAAAPAIPDFAFETSGRQETLSGVLETRPALLALFAQSPSAARLAQLAAVQKQVASRLRILAIDLAPTPRPLETETPSPLVGVSADVAASLALFRTPDDGGETNLLLDRAGSPRARWTGSNTLPDPQTLVANAARVAQFPVAPASHMGHAH